MRRNAMCLVVSLLILGVGIGCKSSEKQSSDVQTAETFAEQYSPSMYNVPVQEYQPYAAEPAPTPIDRYPQTMSASVSMETSATYHTVTKKDTLYGLARAYYSDASRWKDIYEANRGEIPDPNRIFVGQRLLIP